MNIYYNPSLTTTQFSNDHVQHCCSIKSQKPANIDLLIINNHTFILTLQKQTWLQVFCNETSLDVQHMLTYLSVG
jgi:hypothetical protein